MSLKREVGNIKIISLKILKIRLKKKLFFRSLGGGGWTDLPRDWFAALAGVISQRGREASELLFEGLQVTINYKK